MKRIIGVFWLTMATVSLVGCQQPYFMTESDYVYYNDVSSAYGHGQYDEIQDVTLMTPRDVTNPDAAEKWNLELDECKRLAIQHNKQIAFLGYQPAEVGTQIDLALSRFDAFVGAGFGWARTDRQTSSTFQTLGTNQNSQTQDLFGNSVFGGAGVGLNSTQGGASEDLTPRQGTPGSNLFELSKRNAAGGFTSFAYNVGYVKTSPANSFTTVNPQWASEINLAIEQPLLQGAGVEFNRAPILIARAQHEQSIKQFELNVQTLLRDVEKNYWQLYFTYQDLYSREVGMNQALATWRKEMNKREVGTAAIPEVAQAREQYEFFRGQRSEATSRVLAAEIALRNLMGLPPEDGRRIIPATPPTLAEYKADWQVAVTEAMDLRPDISSQRFVVRAAEIEVLRQKNGLLPDLTVGANYRITGLDNQFDQSIDRLTDNNFTDWGLNVRWRRQIGERSANATTRNAKLALSRQQATLRNLQHNANHSLAAALQGIVGQYDLIRIRQNRREAAAQFLESQEQFYRQGKTTIDVLLDAQNKFADALRDENQSIVGYNQALADWEFERGTILENDNISLAEQQISLASEDLRDQRWKQWIKSLPIPIHKGNKVHKNFEECPDTSLPLYPMDLIETTDPVLNEQAPEMSTKQAEPVSELETMKPIPAAEPAMPKALPGEVKNDANEFRSLPLGKTEE